MIAATALPTALPNASDAPRPPAREVPPEEWLAVIRWAAARQRVRAGTAHDEVVSRASLSACLLARRGRRVTSTILWHCVRFARLNRGEEVGRAKRRREHEREAGLARAAEVGADVSASSARDRIDGRDLFARVGELCGARAREVAFRHLAGETFEAIGESLGVTRQRAAQIFERAVGRLSKTLT